MINMNGHVISINWMNYLLLFIFCSLYLHFLLDLDKESVLEDKYRDQLQRDIVKLIDELTKTTESQAIINACSQLKQLLKHNPKEKIQLITKNGVHQLILSIWSYCRSYRS